MDIDRCARVILSGAGRETGHLVDDPVRMAAAIVGRDAVVPAAHALADDWVSSGARSSAQMTRRGPRDWCRWVGPSHCCCG